MFQTGGVRHIMQQTGCQKVPTITGNYLKVDLASFSASFFRDGLPGIICNVLIWYSKQDKTNCNNYLQCIHQIVTFVLESSSDVHQRPQTVTVLWDIYCCFTWSPNRILKNKAS